MKYEVKVEIRRDGKPNETETLHVTCSNEIDAAIAALNSMRIKQASHPRKYANADFAVAADGVREV